MAKLIFHTDKVSNIEEFKKLCPFGAITYEDGKLSSTSGCRMCKLCVKNGPQGAVEYVEDEKKEIDKSLWRGIAVYVDHDENAVHPVTFELVGKARELADKTNQEVYCLLMGDKTESFSKELLHYGVDKVYSYEYEELKYYTAETYANVFEDFIEKVKPSAILVGATSTGRELAPKVAARFETGLTADCTILDMDENTDLIQIRPAFGGNIMAQIVTPNSRPQLATVRYKIMNAPQRQENESGEVIKCEIAKEKLASKTEVLKVNPKERQKSIENADILVAAGRGVKTKEDLELLKELAELLNGELACTRPLVEAGWMDAKNQIGLSGRSVRPKLIITCGVSGAVQFTAGMNNSEYIFAINKDETAPIFKTANYGVVGDIYEIVPKLIARIKEGI